MLAQQMLKNYRRKGSISLYKGTPVIEIPNFILDEDNTEIAFSEQDAFVLPVAEKPVIVAMKGESYIKENEHPTGSVEQQFHKIMGVGILIFNNLGLYTDTTLPAAGNYCWWIYLQILKIINGEKVLLPNLLKVRSKINESIYFR